MCDCPTGKSEGNFCPALPSETGRAAMPHRETLESGCPFG